MAQLKVRGSGLAATITGLVGVGGFILLWIVAALLSLAVPAFICWAVYRLIKKYA